MDHHPDAPRSLRWIEVVAFLLVVLVIFAVAALVGCRAHLGPRDQEELASLAEARVSDCVRATRIDRLATCDRSSKCATSVLAAADAIQVLLEERAAGGSTRLQDEVSAAGKVQAARASCEPVRTVKRLDLGVSRPADMGSRVDMGSQVDLRPVLDAHPLDAQPVDMQVAPVAWALALFGRILAAIQEARKRRAEAEAERGRAAVERVRRAAEVAERERAAAERAASNGS